MNLDPITIEVVLSRLRETTESMAHALFHSGYSPILRESQDGTAGLTDGAGRVVMVGGGLQYHSLLYSRAIGSIFERYPAEDMRDGDSFVCNDPYKAGNSHVPDFVVATPAFFEGRIVAFGVSVAHKADVGGLVPGSSGAAAREIFHDGILVPPVRMWTAAGVNAEIEAIVRNNSRIPDMVMGDLRGQVGATRLGARRMVELCEAFGADVVTGTMDALMTRTTARVRAAVAAWADGVAEAEGVMDHDGAERARPVRIHVRTRKAGDRLTIDFSGSDPQTAGPINTPEPTARAVSMQAILAASDPTIPMNTGAFEAVDFVDPAGARREPAIPGHRQPLLPDLAHGLQRRPRRARGRSTRTARWRRPGSGPGRWRSATREGRAGKATVQYELMNTSLGGTSRRRRRRDPDADEPFRARHAGRDRRDRVSDPGGALRAARRQRGRRHPSRRRRFRPRIRLPHRLHADAQDRQPPPRRLGAVRRRRPVPGGDPDPLPRRQGRGDGRVGDEAGGGGHHAPPLPVGRRRLRRPLRPPARAWCWPTSRTAMSRREAARALYGVAVTRGRRAGRGGDGAVARGAENADL